MKKTIGWLVGVIVAILVLSILLGILVVFFKDKINVEAWWPQSVSVVDRNVQDSLPAQANGGLTPAEVKVMREDDGRPYSEDIIRDFYIYEMQDYVIMYRKSVSLSGVEKYPNLLFRKTERGLVYDGTVGIKASVPVNWFSGKHDFKNGKIDLDMTKATYNLEKNKGFTLFFNALIWPLNPGSSSHKENVVTFSDFNADFAPNYFNTNFFTYLTTNVSETAKLRNWVIDKLSVMLTQPYFMQLSDNLTEGYVNLIGGENLQENTELLNSYATYLFNNSKTEDKTDNTKILDLKNYFSHYIKDSEQNKYPIPLEKQELYNGKTLYAMYSGNVIANIQYSYLNSNIERNETKVKENTSGQFVAPLPAENINYTIVNVKLNSKENTDLTGLDLVNTPVTIFFNDKKVLFNSNEQLSKSKQIALVTGETAIYELLSDELLFDSYSGNINVISNFMNVNFDYFYNAGLVPVTVRLNNLTNINTSLINLNEYPVNIAFSLVNQTKAESFRFNSNEMLTSTINKSLISGIYNYVIFSEQLLFTPSAGVVEIKADNRDFIFNYNVNFEDEEYNVELLKADGFNYDPNSVAFYLHSSVGYEKVYVTIEIYTEDMSYLNNSKTFLLADSTQIFALNVQSVYGRVNNIVVKVEKDGVVYSLKEPVSFVFDDNGSNRIFDVIFSEK